MKVYFQKETSYEQESLKHFFPDLTAFCEELMGYVTRLSAHLTLCDNCIETSRAIMKQETLNNLEKDALVTKLTKPLTTLSVCIRTEFYEKFFRILNRYEFCLQFLNN